MTVATRWAPIAVCCLLIFLGGLLPAANCPAMDPDATNRAIKTNRIRIGELKLQIQHHLEKIRQNSEEEISLLGELEQIDKDLNAGKKRLAALKQELAKRHTLLAEKTRELDHISRTREKVRLHLEKRLRSFYLMGKTGFFNVAFSRKSLPDLMLFDDAYKQMLPYDQEIINRYRKTITDLKKTKQDIELQKNIFADLVRQAEKEEQALQTVKEKKARLLTRIRSEKILYEQAIREMQKAEHNLTTTIARLLQEKRNQQRGFLLNKGRLQGPVEGEIVTRFGEMVDNSPCKGIIIHTDENAPVVSIFTGNVIFAGYRLGYGNMVIIDHGLGYYTITAHLDDIVVKNGDRVLGGEQIGTTGDIATLFSKGLYFEIRKNSTPVDPLKWLSPSAYHKFIPLPRPKFDHDSPLTTVRERTISPGEQNHRKTETPKQ